jgi:hypothetical protein
MLTDYSVGSSVDLQRPSSARLLRYLAKCDFVADDAVDNLFGMLPVLDSPMHHDSTALDASLKPPLASPGGSLTTFTSTIDEPVDDAAVSSCVVDTCQLFSSR